MTQVMDCFSVGIYTVLILNSPPPSNWNNGISIDNVEYETEIVYDFPNAIGIKGKGSFKNKTVKFN